MACAARLRPLDRSLETVQGAFPLELIPGPGGARGPSLISLCASVAGAEAMGPHLGPAWARDLAEPLGEEVIALVVDDDEGGEVFDVDLPDGFHAEFWVLEDVNLGPT